MLHLAGHFVAVPGSLYHSQLFSGSGPISVSLLLGEEFEWQGLPLLVLSACSTAIMDAGNGAMQELGNLFIERGVSSVLGTLWPVSDMASSRLVSQFYHHLASHDDFRPSIALAQAQRACLLNSSSVEIPVRTTRGLDISLSQPDYSHPYYWAGYKVQTI